MHRIMLPNPHPDSGTHQPPLLPLDVEESNQGHDRTCAFCKGAGLLDVLDAVGRFELAPCYCNPLRKNYVLRKTGLYGKLLDLKLGDMERDKFSETGIALAEEFIENPHGFLCFWGPFGTGKTHLLVGIVRGCIGRGNKALYIEAPDLLQSLKDTFDDDNVAFRTRFWGFCENVLALDEVDKINPTPWAISTLRRLLHTRYNYRRGTLLAMNENPEGQKKKPGWFEKHHLESVLDRILGMENLGIIHCTGKNRRRA